MNSESLPRRGPRAAASLWTFAAAGLFLGLTAALAFVHLWRLDRVPRGLHVDESAIGLNAATLAESGRDERGAPFPVYFRSFGDWKNPLIIYTAAGLFRLVGPSIFLLRLASALWCGLLLAGLALLARRLFPERRGPVLWALAAGGSLPWFFPVSRFCSEAMPQPALVAWALCLVHVAYEPVAAPDGRGRRGAALAAGLVLELSIYSYSTARLLTPLLCAAVLAVYAGRRTWRRHLVFAAGFGLALVPYVLFQLHNPAKLSRRFHFVSYVFKRRFTPGEKAAMFVERYLASWSPDFLLLAGDPNRRHATGAGGELYAVVLVLALVGLAWAVRRIVRRRDRFALLLLLGLLAAPVAAALTRELSALRTILQGLFLLVFSLYGLARLGGLPWPGIRRTVLAAAVLFLAVESGHFLRHYFGPYAEESALAFRSHDYPGLLATAYNQGARRIEVSWRANQPYAHVGFYRRILPPPPGVELTMVEIPRAAPGVCAILFNPRAPVHDDRRLARRDWGGRDPVRMRCWRAAAPVPDAGSG